MGYVVGGVDGTVSVDHIQRDEEGGLFTCNHDSGGSFMINSVRFNPNTGAFATGASDGHVFFWDRDRKGRARAKQFNRRTSADLRLRSITPHLTLGQFLCRPTRATC